MRVKLLEVRDSMTFIPVWAFRMSEDEAPTTWDTGDAAANVHANTLIANTQCQAFLLRRAGFGPGDDVVGERRREDAAALAVLGAVPRWLDFPDPQYGERPARAVLRHVPITADGRLDMEAFHRLLSERTKMVAFAAVSNTLGTINPVAEIVAKAHAAGALVLVDAAQSVPHMTVDAQALDCDLHVG